MRTIMILAFVLIGTIGHAQESKSIKLVQEGDVIEFKSKRNAYLTMDEKEVSVKGTFVVTDVDIYEGRVIGVTVINSDKETYNLALEYLVYAEADNKLEVNPKK